jgi:hypothetical protein
VSEPEPVPKSEAALLSAIEQRYWKVSIIGWIGHAVVGVVVVVTLCREVAAGKCHCSDEKSVHVSGSNVHIERPWTEADTIRENARIITQSQLDKERTP